LKVNSTWNVLLNAYRLFIRKLKENSSTGTLIRFLWFLFLYFTGRYFLLLFEGFLFFSLLHEPFLFTVNQVSTAFLGLFYDNLTSTPEYIVWINNREVIRLAAGCSGLQPVLRITFILMLYPVSWKAKAWLLPLSWFILVVAAAIHFILLIPVAFHWPEYYSFSHNWGTRIIFYGFYFLTWRIWEKVGFPSC